MQNMVRIINQTYKKYKSKYNNIRLTVVLDGEVVLAERLIAEADSRSVAIVLKS